MRGCAERGNVGTSTPTHAGHFFVFCFRLRQPAAKPRGAATRQLLSKPIQQPSSATDLAPLSAEAVGRRWCGNQPGLPKNKKKYELLYVWYNPRCWLAKVAPTREIWREFCSNRRRRHSLFSRRDETKPKRKDTKTLPSRLLLPKLFFSFSPFFPFSHVLFLSFVFSFFLSGVRVCCACLIYYHKSWQCCALSTHSLLQR